MSTEPEHQQNGFVAIPFLAWMWVAIFVMMIVGTFTVEGVRLLWPTTPGVVATSGGTYSYAVSGREFTGSLHPDDDTPLPAPGSEVSVHYNPLVPSSSYLGADVLALHTMGLLLVGALPGFGVVMIGRRTEGAWEAGFGLASIYVWLLGGGAVVLAPLIVILSALPGGGPNFRPLLTIWTGVPAALGVMAWLGPYPSPGAWVNGVWAALQKEAK